MSSEAKNLEAISKAIDAHNEGCEWPAVAVEMTPSSRRLGWDSTAACPPPQCGAERGRFRVVCAREEASRARSRWWRRCPTRRARRAAASR